MHKQTWKTNDKKQTKIFDKHHQQKTTPLDRTKSSIQANLRTNSEQVSENKKQKHYDNKRPIPTNPFRKLVNRHYGSFKVKIKGNPSKTFDSLPNYFKEKGKLGTTRRKFLKKTNYSLIIYSNGTIEIKPSQKNSNSLNAGEDLSNAFWTTFQEAKNFLETIGLFTSSPVMNRRPKYAVPDKTAELVRKEVHAEYRDMDKSVKPGHVDNWGKQALARDNRLSSDQHFALAKARLENPEILGSIEDKLEDIVEAQKVSLDFSNNLKLHLEVERRQLENMVKMNRLLAPKRIRMPTAFKTSATVRGVA